MPKAKKQTQKTMDNAQRIVRVWTPSGKVFHYTSFTAMKKHKKLGLEMKDMAFSRMRSKAVLEAEKEGCEIACSWYDPLDGKAFASKAKMTEKKRAERIARSYAFEFFCAYTSSNVKELNLLEIK